jgi:dTDP-4-amino-4,6-dideoxygalactose transaminase
MKVKFHNIYKSLIDKKKIERKIINLIRENKFVGGDEVLKFEKNFSTFVGSKNCISVGNGTDALEIALEVLNIKKGSEIIVPVNTWISTAEIVKRQGYKLVFCDINLKDYSIDLKDLKKKINKKTKVIIPVHLYGFPSNMSKIKEIVKGKNIKIIEDCAQALGAKIKNQHVGTFGDIGTFSFYPGKNLGAFGDGGCLITNNKDYANLSQRLKNHGALKKYDHTILGRNSRLDTIQSAVLNIRLKSYDKIVKKRQLNAKYYLKELKNMKDLQLPIQSRENTYAYHQFVIRLNKRDLLQNYLKKNGVETMIHYHYMLSELSIFRDSKGKKTLKNSKRLGKRILSLPISEEHTKKEIYFVINLIKKFF